MAVGTAALEQVVRVTCQGEIIGEMVYKNGTLKRRDKSLPNHIVVRVNHLFTKGEFDWGRFEYQGKNWHFKEADFESKLVG